MSKLADFISPVYVTPSRVKLKSPVGLVFKEEEAAIDIENLPFGYIFLGKSISKSSGPKSFFPRISSLFTLLSADNILVSLFSKLTDSSMDNTSISLFTILADSSTDNTSVVLASAAPADETKTNKIMSIDKTTNKYLLDFIIYPRL